MDYKDNNTVNIVGVINEINVEQREKDGRNYVTGNIKIETGNGNIIPVNVFSFEKTKKGTTNPSYTQIMAVCDKGVSMAAVNGEVAKATKIRASGCRLEENMWVSRFTNNVTSSIRVTGSFFTLNSNEEPKAKFNCGIYIQAIRDEVDNEGEETGRLLIDGFIEQYNRWDKITFIADPKVASQSVNYIRNNWEKGDTVSISGEIIEKTIIQKIVNDDTGGFGEPEEEVRTFHRIEYVITRGSEPKEDVFAYDITKVKEGIADRERRMAELQEGNKSKPAATAKFDDIDF